MNAIAMQTGRWSVLQYSVQSNVNNPEYDFCGASLNGSTLDLGDVERLPFSHTEVAEFASSR